MPLIYLVTFLNGEYFHPSNHIARILIEVKSYIFDWPVKLTHSSFAFGVVIRAWRRRRPDSIHPFIDGVELREMEEER